MNWFKNILKKYNKQEKLPSFLRPFLWSYDLEKIDKEKHKAIIIKNILDYGTSEATDWLRGEYTKKEIQEVIQKTVRLDWSKKSINLWELIYRVAPRENRL
jgi:hypothetical protein